MYKTYSLSDSIVGSLCREIDYLQSRSTSIIRSLNTCQSNTLIKRLKEELSSHKERLESIQKISKSMLNKNNPDELSIEFLIEMSNRRLTF